MTKKYFRRILHLYKSGCIVIGIEHFLVMFPSAMLIAKLTNTTFGSIMELPEILMACGFGSFLFALLSKGKIPFFLGPSFSYIGFVSYQVAQISSPNDVDVIRSTIFWGYLIAGVFLLLLSWIYRYKTVKKIINTLFPSTVMGPSISLIGLELANMAAQDSGFIGGTTSIRILAIITLFFIIIFSLFKHHFLHNASVLIGVIIGCLFAILLKQVTLPNVRIDSVVWSIPIHIIGVKHYPQNWFTLALMVLPCSLIAFIESLGRISVFQGMLQRDKWTLDEKERNNAISNHAFTSIITSAVNMTPSAIYAENLAIMNLHSADLLTKDIKRKDEDPFINNCYSPYSIYPYMIASFICVIVALVHGLQDLFLAIPLPVLGGMEMFVFGLIAAPGIQMLVDQQVDYKKISNQIITASVFLAGISSITLKYGSLTLKGMSLGLTTGVAVNILTLVLNHFGLLNERISLYEVIDEFSVLSKERIKISAHNAQLKQVQNFELDSQNATEYIRRKEIKETIKSAKIVVLEEAVSKRRVLIAQKAGQLKLQVNLPKKYKIRLLNDHPRITYFENWKQSQSIVIILDEHISKRILSEILENAK